jgi:hypothetical protein
LSVLSVLDRDAGDTKLEWDVDNEAEVAAAKSHFLQLKGEGYLAYRVDADGNEVIREFDASAPKIIMSPQLVGG